MSASNQLKDFSFPFPPYEIQNEFMIALCEALEGKKLGIFESPTGTGKSLSLICGALTWLEHHSAVHKEVLKSLVEESIKDDDDEDWFNSATKRIEKENEKRKAKKELDKIEREEKRMNNLRSRKAHVKQKLLESKNMDDEFRESFKDSRKEKDNSHELTRESELSLLENEFLLDDYTSEGEEDTNESDPEEEDGGCLKIFYCSRTHSQLSQFVREIQKTRFRHDARVTSLASRQNFCVNEEVSRLPSLAMINERCIDLQTGQKGISTKTDGNQTAKKKKTSSGCPFNKQMKIQNLSDQVLLEVQDLEQLISLGRKSKACPYYASRKCVKDSQLVILPYNCLLHKSTREACNIKLKDNVVIVDEAHNLLETIGNIHSVTISFQQVCCATCQLSEYVRRYEKRLSPRNLLYIRQISFLIKAYTKILSSDSTLGGNTTSNGNKISVRLLTLQDFLFETLTDNLNLFKLIQYIEKSKLAHKLHGYKKLFEGEIKIKSKESQLKDTASTSSFLAKMASAKTPENKTRERNKDETESNSSKTEFLQTKNDDEMNFGSPFFGITEFLKSITCGNSDGRIVVSVSKDRKKPFIKYLLLNPASQFHDIVRECRSVIVAGGTMAPMDEFKNQLFLSAGASLDRLVEFSCSHVVSEENVLPLVMARGPGNVLMDFTFKNRNETRLLDELGRTLMNICNIVPGGIVCFFPSYEYEDTVYEYFHRTKIIEKISNKKRVFREPKKSSQLEKVLSGYCDAIQMGDRNRGKGAVLFSVVGGKMSEGINFSDDLGRCIVMVGLPYPNATSPELREKMDYLTKHFPCTSDGKTAGTWYYENLCFKAVNQSIGRSIRHRNDFASILLLDHRYCLKSSQARLPSWISSRIKICNQFGQAFSFIRKFFADRKK